MIAPRDGTSVAISDTRETVLSCLADGGAAAPCARSPEPRRRRVVGRRLRDRDRAGSKRWLFLGRRRRDARRQAGNEPATLDADARRAACPRDRRDGRVGGVAGATRRTR